MSSFQQLQNRVNNRTATVAIIGLGYVWLPLLRAFRDGGYPVLGFDIDPEKIAKLQCCCKFDESRNLAKNS